MNQIVSTAIVLHRTDYGEADRILTFLTPDHGKVRLIAKGVRRVKSKLAGGVELFSISDITFIKGRQNGIGTLVSARLKVHYAKIVQDLARITAGYEYVRQINKFTEDEPEPEYFLLLQQSFEALNDPQIPLELIEAWIYAQVLRLSGHAPNLHTDSSGQKLQADLAYDFDLSSMSFASDPEGIFSSTQIKFLRLLFDGLSPLALSRVQKAREVSVDCSKLIKRCIELGA